MTQKQKKSKKKWPWLLGGIALVVISVLVFGPRRAPSFIAINTQMCSVSKGSITQTVVGTGSLEYCEETEVKLPIGIKILDVNLDTGDAFLPGDIIATVDSVSLTTQITSIQTEIRSLDRKINSKKEDTDDEYLTASVAGRVKQIFSEEDRLITDIMGENGALMILSTDQMMAVDFKTADIYSIGEEVVIFFENGSNKVGKI